MALGQILFQASGFLRNVVVARALPRPEYGVAAIFLLTVYFLEMGSNLNMEKLLIQAKDGDDPRFQRTAQFIRVVQGLLMGLILLALSPVLAHWFGIQERVGAFRLLALVPVLSSLAHFDMHRVQRRMEYRKIVIADVASQVSALIFVLVLVHWISDASLVVYALLCRTCTLVAASHILGSRKYGWSWQPEFGRRMIVFGWPLMLNGLLLFFVLQGDSFLIGSAQAIDSIGDAIWEGRLQWRVYSKDDLAIYALAMGFTIVPMMMLAKISTALFLPILAEAHARKQSMESRAAMVSETMAVSAALIASVFVLAGTFLVVTVYTDKYLGVKPIIGWLGAMQAIRILRIGPTITALAHADSRNSLRSNVARSLALIGALGATVLGAELYWLAVFGVLGELAALVVSVRLLRTVHGVAISSMRRQFLFVTGATLGAVLVQFLSPAGGGAISVWAAAGYCVGIMALSFKVFPTTISELRRIMAEAKGARA